MTIQAYGPLENAIANGHFDVVEYLLNLSTQAGTEESSSPPRTRIDVNRRDSFPLHTAVSISDANIELRMRKQRPGNTVGPSEKRMDPSDYRLLMIDRLLQAGANITAISETRGNLV